MKIGTLELVVILLVAFLVLGPDRTLAYTRKIGKGLRTLKVYMDSFTDDIKENVTEPLNELTQPLTEIAKPLDDIARTVQEPLKELDMTVKQSEIKLNSTTPAKPKTSVPAVEELEEAIPMQETEKE